MLRSGIHRLSTFFLSIIGVKSHLYIMDVQIIICESRLGDSGGPLMCQRKDSCAWYIAGIISWSYSCGETYGVYMSTNYYRDWALTAVNST